MRAAELGILLAIGLGGTATLARAFPRLKGPVTEGIVALELPRTTRRARAVVGAWRAHHRLGAARRSVLVDVPFVAAYVLALAAFAALMAKAGDTDARLLVTGAVTAGALDLVENAGLWLMLGGRTGQPIPLATSIASAIKWVLIPLVAVSALVTALT